MGDRFPVYHELPGRCRVTIRPIAAEDAEMEARFVRMLSPESRYLRFMYALKELTPALLDRLINPVAPGEAALIATVSVDGQEVEIAVARFAAGETPGEAEFAIVVADEWQGQGLARRLMEELAALARESGLSCLKGVTLAENRAMLALAESQGFRRHRLQDDAGLVGLVRSL